jgi:hypothetical protein
MSEWRWMIGNEIDVAVDKFIAEGKWLHGLEMSTTTSTELE